MSLPAMAPAINGAPCPVRIDQCWAKGVTAAGSFFPVARCLENVNPDPDAIGLCPRHLAAYRQDPCRGNLLTGETAGVMIPT